MAARAASWLFALAAAARGATGTESSSAPTPAPAQHAPVPWVSDQGLEITSTHQPPGCADAEQVVDGATVGVKYIAKLEDGEVFAEQRDRPFEFVVGASDVIKGWEQGVTGMCVGEKRSLRVPPALGFGDDGNGPVPPGAHITFDLELVHLGRVLHAHPEGLTNNHVENEWHFFSNADTDGSGTLTESELARYWKIFGVKTTWAEVTAKHIDANGDGELSWDEWFIPEKVHQELRRRRLKLAQQQAGGARGGAAR